MKKRIITLLLTSCLVCSLFTGCMKDEDTAQSLPSDWNISTELTEETSSVESTPAPTVEPTPEATVETTVEATVEATSESAEFEYGTITLPEGYELWNCFGGIIYTCYNDFAGTMDYEGNVIVENNYYDSYWDTAFNDEGYFALHSNTDNKADIYNRSGELIYTINKPSSININEGVISYLRENPAVEGENICEAYQIETGKLVEFSSSPYYDIEKTFLGQCSVRRTTACVDGKIYISTHNYNVYQYDFATDSFEAVTLGFVDALANCYLDQVYDLRMSYAPNGGWSAVLGLSESDRAHLLDYYKIDDVNLDRLNDGHVLGILSMEKVEDGIGYQYYKEEYEEREKTNNKMIKFNQADWYERKLIIPQDLFDYAGLEYKDDAAWNLAYFKEDGISLGNVGQLVALSLNSGGVTKYCLLDFSKAELNRMRLVTNLEDIVVCIVDYIALSEDGIFLVGTGEDWYYIDETGQKVADYDDCSAFVNGLAMVVEDGMAYIIDTEWNKLTDGVPATSVYTSGDMFVCVNGDVESYFYTK